MLIVLITETCKHVNIATGVSAAFLQCLPRFATHVLVYGCCVLHKSNASTCCFLVFSSSTVEHVKVKVVQTWKKECFSFAEKNQNWPGHDTIVCVSSLHRNIVLIRIWTLIGVCCACQLRQTYIVLTSLLKLNLNCNSNMTVH